VDPDDFTRVAHCQYKGEHYSVRDNGAVLRHARENKPHRKYDNQWTFGKVNDKGYPALASEVVHRIVAFAFLGEPPANQHIVEHIDRNRQNNRPSNLRCLTKLETSLKNPITQQKIIWHCGSIEAFLKDPSILKNYEKEDPNFGWMRAVTAEEARSSYENLSRWVAQAQNTGAATGNSLGEWIFRDRDSSSKKTPEFTDALSVNAVQKNWKTPCEFPCCPQAGSGDSVTVYFSNLRIGEIFACNKYFESLIVDFAVSDDKGTLWVMCHSSDNNAIKPWSLAEITFENDRFVHANLGSFFNKEGAEKQLTWVQGLEWTGDDSIDDYM